ncbi:MAG: hypothetical protein P8144_09460, partial [Gammaproteobacteria bacterium]
RILRFEMWTNGLFHPTALTWLQGQKTELRDQGYSVHWKDGLADKNYCNKVKDKSIQNILREHYFNHPLTKLTSEK